MLLSESKWKDYFEGLRRVLPCHTNRASMLGDPCERRLVLWRTSWEKAALPPVWLQEAFEMGKDTERQAIDRLIAAGYQIRRQQAPMMWREYNITGHIEGEISEDGENWTLFEIKALEKYRAMKINHWRDFLGNPIYQRYPTQGQLYMLMFEVPEMLFIVIPKGTFSYRFIPMELDYEYAEGILQKAERINQHVADGALPECFIDLCDEDCPFYHLCLPAKDCGAGAEIETDPEFLDLLERRQELMPVSKEYEQANREIKERCGTRPLIIAGDFEITGTMRQRTGYTVEDTSYWNVSIKRLNK